MSDVRHWAEYKERIHGWQMSLILALVKFLPGVVVRAVAVPVGFFYWLTSRGQRRAVSEYLSKIYRGRHRCTLKNFVAFAIAIIEKVESWAGKIKLEDVGFCHDDVDGLREVLGQKGGAVLICSHLGNIELLRAAVSCDRKWSSRPVPIISIVDFSVTSGFNRMLKRVNSNSMLHLISAYDIGSDTMIRLQEHVAAGGIVVIAGDRVPARNPMRTFDLDFLGDVAQFPQGPFVMASLLEVPTYFVFAVREGDLSVRAKYTMHFHRASVVFSCARSERRHGVKALAEEFASYLEEYCRKYPYQWYNFYEFWKKADR